MTSMKRIEPDALPRADFASIPRYSAAATSELDLSDNTNQWGTPPGAAAAIRAGIDVSRYPDMYGDSLKRTIAAKAGIGPECVVTGNGSDDVLDYCVIRAFAAPGDVVAHPDPTFVMVPVFSRINGIDTCSSSARDGFFDGCRRAACDERTHHLPLFAEQPDSDAHVGR